MDIENFSTPPELISRPYAAGITFKPLSPEIFEEMMKFQREHFSKYPGWIDMYLRLGLTENYADAIVALASNGKIIGSVIVFSPQGRNFLAEDIPWPRLIRMKRAVSCLCR